jgi:hypothetical protein
MSQSKLSVLEICDYVQALHFWIDRGIERGLSDDEIVEELKVMAVALHPRVPMPGFLDHKGDKHV